MSAAWLGQAERGGFAALRLATWITRLAGRPVGRALLVPTCGYFLAFAPRARQASSAYLRRVLAAPAGLAQVFRHFHVFASTLLDRIEMLSRGGERFDIQLHDAPALERMLAQGRGCLLLGSHLGSFEILRAFGERHRHLAINLVMRGDNARATGRWMRRMAPELSDRVIAAGEPQTLLRVRECLERGEIVGMLGDRTLKADKTIRCDFLGAPAHFPQGPLLLAAILKAPVVLFFGIYLGGRRYAIHFEPFADALEISRHDRTAQLTPWIERYAERVEHYCRRAPYNWFNFYDFWRA